jgi:hypothetical protein
MDANEIGTVWRAIDFAVRERYSKGFFWITSSFLCVCVCGKMMMTHLVNKGHRPSSLFLFFFFLFRCKVGHDIINRDQHYYRKKMSNRMRRFPVWLASFCLALFIYYSKTVSSSGNNVMRSLYLDCCCCCCCVNGEMKDCRDRIPFNSFPFIFSRRFWLTLWCHD